VSPPDPAAFVEEIMAAHTDYAPVLADRLPRTEEVNGEPVTLRLMTADDATALHTFFQEMAEENPYDLLFLRRDVTSGKEIDVWLQEIAAGEAVTVLAVADGQVLGEASLHRNDVPWTRHVGNVRVIVDAQQRGRGLSRLLLGEVFAIALSCGIERVVAEMMAEQASAKGLFASIGFVEEGRFHAYARDLDGNLHDLVFMTAGRPEMQKLIHH
jgi:L-amino acid N-acyltransferase YncA